MARVSYRFRTLDSKIWGELAAGLMATAALAGLLGWLTNGPYLPPGAFLAYTAIAMVVAVSWPGRQTSLGWANRITLLRGSLIAVILGYLVHEDSLAREGLLLAGMALVALLLDGVDGWVARRTASCSRFGRRFDMELDALLILTLCVASMTLGKVGVWVLSIGLMRYAFVVAGHLLPWLKRELPDSLRRKAICVIQGAVLLLILLPFINPDWASGLAALALGLLGLSFGMDIHWLFHRRATGGIHKTLPSPAHPGSSISSGDSRHDAFQPLHHRFAPSASSPPAPGAAERPGDRPAGMGGKAYL